MRQSKYTAFIVMPFSNSTANNAYRHSVLPILESLNYQVVRADDIYGTSPIFDDILQGIQQAALIVVDISGLNANVMYELGMAHMIKRPQTVIITQDPFEKIPFDIKHFRIIRYEDSIAGKADFETKFMKTVQGVQTATIELYRSEFEVLETIMNPSEFYGLIAIAQESEPIRAEVMIHVVGYSPKGKSEGSFKSVQHGLRRLIKLDYLRSIDGNMALTAKGQTFVKYLGDQGYVLETFTIRTIPNDINRGD